MILIDNIKQMFNSGECFLYGGYSIGVKIDDCNFMDCYVSIVNSEEQTEHKIFFNECAKKVTDIFGKKFIDTMTQKVDSYIQSQEDYKEIEHNRKNLKKLEDCLDDFLFDMWDDYLNEICGYWYIYEMDDFDEAFFDRSPKDIMRYSNGNFNPDHTFYAYNEEHTAYISFDYLSEYEPYMKRREDFIMFLVREGYCF